MEVPWRHLIALCLGLGFLALAIAAAVDLHRFTPVYEDVVCKPTSTGLSSVQVSPLQVTIAVNIVCKNPNPYDIAVYPAGVGRALLGEAQQDVGRVTSAETVVPAAERGEVAQGTLVMNVQVQLGFFETLSLMSSLLQGAFTIFFDLKLAVMIDPVILGLSAGLVEIQVQQSCGMQIQVLPSQDSGDCVCSDTGFDALIVPPIEEASADDMGISPDVSEETIEAAEQARDAFCGTVMALSLLLAVIIISCTIVSFLRKHRSKPAHGVTVIQRDASNAPVSVIGRRGE
mmetsp:Transcript_6205/g.15223  ORF Transcript_6205/g.15223 Transcript_6205/m.15223 type:complete len:287 (-) Transcript_6205:123-983(-)